MIQRVTEILGIQKKNVFRIVSIFGLCVLVITLALHSISPTSAASNIPFGGLIEEVFTCTCTDNFAITIKDVSTSPGTPPIYIYQPGVTTLYEFGQIYKVGAYTLGLRSEGGTCQYYVGKTCTTYTTSGTMIMVGTSR